MNNWFYLVITGLFEILLIFWDVFKYLYKISKKRKEASNWWERETDKVKQVETKGEVFF